MWAFSSAAQQLLEPRTESQDNSLKASLIAQSSIKNISNISPYLLFIIAGAWRVFVSRGKCALEFVGRLPPEDGPPHFWEWVFLDAEVIFLCLWPSARAVELRQPKHPVFYNHPSLLTCPLTSPATITAQAEKRNGRGSGAESLC